MESEQFVYEKVINAIIEMIRVEGYAPGSKLPGVRDLADKFGCNLHTVRKAIAFLSEDGVVEQRMRLGNFVRCSTSHLVGRAQPRVQIVSTRRIGVLLFPKDSEFLAVMLIELERTAIRLDLQLEHHIVTNWKGAATAVRSMKRNGCRAVIGVWDALNSNTPEARAFLDNSPLPVVLGRSVPGYESWYYEPRELYLWFDRDTIRFQFRYFRALGFRHIAYFSRRDAGGKGSTHCRCYEECAAAEATLPDCAFAGPDPAEVDAALAGWDPHRGSLAVLCFDDIEAMRLVIAARKRGWNLPDDLAVMGVNNFFFGRHVDPPLSTVLFPYRYMVERQLLRALDFSEGRTEFGDIVLPHLEVLLRESCSGRRKLSPEQLRQLLDTLGVTLVEDSPFVSSSVSHVAEARGARNTVSSGASRS